VPNIGLQGHEKYIVAEIITMIIAVFFPYNCSFCQLVTWRFSFHHLLL